MRTRSFMIRFLIAVAILQGGCTYLGRRNLQQNLVQLPDFISQMKKQIILASACASVKDPIFYLGGVEITLQTAITGTASAGAPIPIGLVPVTVNAGLSSAETQQVVIKLTPLDVSLGRIKIFLKDSGAEGKQVSDNIEDATFIGDYLVYHSKAAADARAVEHWVEKTRVARIETETKIPDILAGLTKEDREKLCAGGATAKPLLDKVLLSP